MERNDLTLYRLAAQHRLSLVVYSSFLAIWVSVYLDIFLSQNDMIITTDLRYPIQEVFFYETGIYLWVTDMFFFTTGYIPLLLMIHAISYIIDYYLVMKIFVALPMFLALLCMYKLSEQIIMSLNGSISNIQRILCIIPAVAYAINPVSLNLYWNNTPVSLGYSILPLVVLLSWKLIIAKRISNVTVALFVFALDIMLIQFHNLIFYFIVPFLIIAVITLLINYHRCNKLLIAKRIFHIGILSILLLAFAFVPLSLVFLSSYFSGQSTPIYTLDNDVLQFMFKDWTFTNDINLISYPWDDSKQVYFKYTIPQSSFKVVGMITFSVLIAVIIFLSPKEGRLYWTLFLISVTLIVTGTGLSFIGKNFSIHIPYGWIIRDNTKFLPLISLGISMIITIFITRINRTKANLIHNISEKAILIAVCGIVIFSTVVKSIPAYTGTDEFMKTYDKERVKQIYEFLKIRSSYGAVASFPTAYWERTYRDTIEMSVPYPLDVYSTVPETQQKFLSQIYSSDNMEPYLDLVDIKYLGFDLNTVEPVLKDSLLQKMTSISNNPNFSLVFSTSDIFVYEYLKDPPHFWIPVSISSESEEKSIQEILVSSLNPQKNVNPSAHVIVSQPNYSLYKDMVSPKTQSQNYLPFSIENERNYWYTSIWFNHNGTKAQGLEYLYLAKSRETDTYVAVGREDHGYLFVEINTVMQFPYKPIHDNGWHNIIVLYDGLSVKVYVDGNMLFFSYENKEIFDLHKSVVYIGRSDKNELSYSDKIGFVEIGQPYGTINDIYSDNLREGFQFNAYIRNYTRISPVEWSLRVDASKPFMLCFAEHFDVFWEAEVYKDGKIIDSVDSVPIYRLINGFWIDTTGDNIEIRIKYKPQSFFQSGMIISIVTLLACIGYTIYRGKMRLLSQSLLSKVIRKI